MQQNILHLRQSARGGIPNIMYG